MLENSAQTNAQVTGMEDPDAQLRQLIGQVTADPNKPVDGTPAPATPRPINLTVGGRNYQFKDEADLSAQLEQTFASFQQPPQEPAPQPQGFVSGREDEDPIRWTDENMKEYVRLMQINPIQAANYLDQKRFGFSDPVQELRRLKDDNEKVSRTLAAYQFKDAHPEFPGGPAAQLLARRVNELGVPFTFEGLDAAYWSLVGQGAFPNPALVRMQQQQQQQGQPNQQVPPNQQAPPFQQPNQFSSGYPPNPNQFQPPPAVPRGNSDYPSPDITRDIENMTTDQIAALLNKYQDMQKKA